MEKKEMNIMEIGIAMFLIAFAIMIIVTIFLEIKQQKINYEIEKMKIEQGTYERKEVNITNERNEEPNKLNTFLGI